PEVTARFLDSAQSRDPMQRLMAIYAIGKLDARANIQTIKQPLGDEVPDIRKIALEALAGACEDDRESRELLIAGLEDENSEVRCAVVEQLGECCSGDVVPHLLRALEDGDDWVKIRAVEALGARRDPQAVAHLAPLLHKSNRLIVLKVLESLGEIGGSAAFQTLIDISNCDEPELVRAAEAAMERIQEEQGSGG
ncbi:MAG: HEAT repeat domain-containing protein, partial [Desulfovibrionaceae bacterium]|nr:HEAT repeat domain-containing protein [Desulfovibrionaceae bacterium]